METKKGSNKIACSVKVGEKGQIVIPKDIRDMFGIEAGDTLMVLADRKRGIAIPPKATFGALAKSIFGGEEDENE